MTPDKSVDPNVRTGHVHLKVVDIVSRRNFRSVKVAMLAVVILLATHLLNAQSPTPENKQEPITPKLFIDESSSSVSFGKAYLTVDPLIHKGQLFLGGYKLTVVPYFMMSEKGVLELEAPDDVMHKILTGTATAFTGKATNNKHGAPKVITGKMTPSMKNQGDVTFSVQTDNGPMVFNTSYHFGD
jgi:hypothetical protein